MQENSASVALDFCKRDPVLYVDISECILRGAAEILYARSENSALDGVLLYERESGIYALAATKTEGAGTALSYLNERDLASKSRWLVAHGEGARKAAYERLHIVRETACFQIAYPFKAPVPLTGSLRFAPPDRKQIETIKKVYSLEPPENIEKLCKQNKIFCGFAPRTADGISEGEFVGFIGSHPEGSMGMLHVFEQFRRRGFAEELEKRLMNLYLESGRVPYGHVITDNSVSLSLQKKLGFEVAGEKVYWLREDENFSV